jgi:GDP-4-dehydro-6-deoxy-D-mannose reductase
MSVWLITGAAGFVGRHLIDLIRATMPADEIWGINRPLAERCDGFAASNDFRVCPLSLSAVDPLADWLKSIRPMYVVHLAAQSSVAASWRDPVNSFLNNTNIFLNLIEAVRLAEVPCRVLSVGSSEEYGPRRQEELPLRESMCPAPANPYAVARVAQEQLSKVYSESYGVEVVCTRSFNHVGPDQSDRFVASAFCRQGVEVALGMKEAMRVGALEIVRDFIDVRDVVRAYVLLLERGVSGSVYNVCTGRGTKLADLVSLVSDAVGRQIPVQQDPSLVRPADNPVIVGDGSKLASLGFELHVPLEQSIREQVATWRERLTNPLSPPAA